jgi:hypothetical protein
MEPRLPKPAAFAILRPAIATAAEGQQPCPATRAEWEEAATPGQPVSRYARFLEIPRQFTLENYRLATGSTAITQRIQELTTFSLNTLSGILFRAATGKNCLPVQNVWTQELPCGSKRKTKNE